MHTKIALLLGLATATTAQLVDDFSCPDEFVGYYPHLISCDKYWYCQDSLPELRTCGNGLGFLDTDDTFTLEQCAELHLVECGDRTEVEAPISTQHCPRLYGTFPDPEDCGVFWKCQDGRPNRYNCPPGLAYDQVNRGCRWADQVEECSSNTIIIDDEGGEFQCPRASRAGTFTKHAHPADCRQYFLCIGGVPREYGCPLGTVFNTVSGTGVDGKCTDPDEVPECSSYYGDLEFDSRDLNRAGADTGRSGEDSERIRSSQRNIQRNSISRTPIRDEAPTFNSVSRDITREKSRPAPPALQQIVDSEPIRAQPPRSRPAPRLPQSQRNHGQFRPREEERQEPATPSPTRLQQIRIQPAPIQTTLPPRIQVLTDRPSLRTTFPRRPEPTTELPTTAQRLQTTNSRFSTASRPSLNSVFSPSTRAPPPPPTTAPPAPAVSDTSDGLPAPVKAAPGPNGEEYYYYYYYYDDDEGKEGSQDATPGS